MADAVATTQDKAKTIRRYPKISIGADGEYNAQMAPDQTLAELTGTRTEDAARGLYQTAIGALGKSAERHAGLASAMFAEMEPTDAVEAMLIAQMTATHVAMTALSEKMSFQTSAEIRERYERSITRLSRTFLAQMDALKKYRAKAQQIVRVERVSVHDGGRAIVGDVNHTGGGHEQN